VGRIRTSEQRQFLIKDICHLYLLKSLAAGEDEDWSVYQEEEVELLIHLGDSSRYCNDVNRTNFQLRYQTSWCSGQHSWVVSKPLNKGSS